MASDKKNNNFHVVELVDGLVTVPSNWLCKNDEETFWPNTTNPTPLIKNKADVQVGWRSYKIFRFFASSETYEEAKVKEGRAEFTSGIDSEEIEINKKQKRREKKRKLLSSSDEEDPREENEECNELLREHDVNKFPKPHKNHKPVQNELSDIDAEIVNDTTESIYSKQVPDNTRSSVIEKSVTPIDAVISTTKKFVKRSVEVSPTTPTCSSADESITPPLKNLSCNASAFDVTLESANNYLSNLTNKESSVSLEQRKFMETMIKLSVDTNKRIRAIEKTVKQLNDHGTLHDNSKFQSENYEARFNAMFPMKRVQEVDNLDKILENDVDFEANLKIMLLGLTENTIQKTCYSLMAYLFTNELGTKYSWLGQKGKKAIQNLRLTHFLRKVILAHHTDTNAGTITAHIKSWLAHRKWKLIEKKEKSKGLQEKNKEKDMEDYEEGSGEQSE